jgi:hypothetical protein
MRDGPEDDGGPIYLTRGAALLVAAAVFIAAVCFYSGIWWAHVLSGLCAEGLVALAWVGAASLIGLIVVRRLRLEMGRMFAFCTAAGLGLGFFSLVILGLGLAGWLNRTTAITLITVSGAIGLCDLIFVGSALRTIVGPTQGIARNADPTTFSTAANAIRISLHRPAGWTWLWIAVMPYLGMAAVGTQAIPELLWKPIDPHPYDVQCYHLQVPREWYEAGRIVPLKHNVYSYFPFAVEMNYLLAMHLHGGPWAGMYLAQLMSLVYMALAVMATIAAVRDDTGSTAKVGLLAGLAMAGMPWVTMLAALAYDESGMLLYVALACGWVLRALNSRSSAVKNMAVAGVMAGLACGVKYTAVPLVLFLLPAAVLAAGMFVRRAAPLRPLINGCALYVVIGAIIFSPWLIRNAAWAGNPVFPLAMRQLGRAHFTEEQVERFARAHRAPENQAGVGERLLAGWREVLNNWQFAWAAIPLAGLSVIRLRNQPTVVFLSIAVGGMAVFWLGFTHLMGRFFVPAIPLLAMLIGYLATAHWKRVPATLLACAASLCFVLSAVGLNRAFSESMKEAYHGLFRLTDLSELNAKELAGIEKSGARLALIGDSQAFKRQMPMSRLEYRTIFDVVTPPGKNICDAWLGQDLEDLRQDHFVVLNPGELRRLSAYYNIPLPPAEWRDAAEAEIVLPPK